MDIMFILRVVFLILICLPFVYVVMILFSKVLDDIMNSMRR